MSAFTVIVLAAGRGTRMRSQTPKVLHEICGRPMVLWPVSAALHAGAGKVVVVDGPERPLAGVLPDGVELAVQERANGTGGAAIAASDRIDPRAPVVVLSGDVPLVEAEAISGLVQAHERSGACATVASTVLGDPSGYGRIVRDSHGSLLRVAETKAEGDASEEELQIREVNTGIYVFEGAALLRALPRLSAENAQGELYLPQALDLLRAEGEKVAVHVVEDERLVLGVNDRAALSQVAAIAQQAIHERHMRAGVTIRDPQSTWIDVDVEIEPGATIEPGTRLSGATSVGPHAVVGPHTVAIDSEIGAQAHVKMSWLEGAAVMESATVGPFAYLRPGAQIGSGAKAGTFVEIKNSDVGAGSKVPHLSYVGDAVIGEDTNLGASTITANYDGYKKNPTRIGSRVRTSVDTTLVAPVELEDDAVIAGGSVITKTVPAGALGIARARQTNIDGYAERRRQEHEAERGKS